MEEVKDGLAQALEGLSHHLTATASPTINGKRHVRG